VSLVQGVVSARVLLASALVALSAASGCTATSSSPDDHQTRQAQHQQSGPPRNPDKQANCADEGARNGPGRHSAIYYWCVNKLRPLRYASDDLSTRRLLSQYQRGLSQSAEQAGWHGGIPETARFTVTETSSTVTMDIDPDSVHVQLLLGTYPWSRPMERTIREATGKGLRVLIGGRTLCQLSDECAG